MESEIMDIMGTWFDQEYLTRQYGQRMEERGEKRGKMEGILNSLRQLMQNLKVSLSEAMNYLGIPDTERASYREAIEGNGTLKVNPDDDEAEEDDDLMFIP